MILYPNPSGNYIKAVLPQRQIGKVNVMIFNSSGMLLADYSEDTFGDVPLFIDVSRFPQGAYSLMITNSATNLTDKSRFVIIRQ
jgi:tRNA-binding EMAP/Myf-like protein